MPIECRQLSPKNVTIDILRIAGATPLPNQILLEVGGLFGFSSNAMRVAINRLMNLGILEKSDPDTNSNNPTSSSSPSTGQTKETSHYRLSTLSDPISEFVGNWRKAEDRIKPWQSDQWLLCHLPKNPDRSLRMRSIKALRLRGFRPGPDNLWIRPDNLSDPFHCLEIQLKQLGLEDQAALIASHKLSTALSQQWLTLWDEPENTLAYTHHFPAMIEALTTSQQQLAEIPIKDAMAESFRLGSSAIHMLTKDPLSPDQLCDTKNRALLCHTMMEYDNVGRKIWQQHIEGLFQQL